MNGIDLIFLVVPPKRWFCWVFASFFFVESENMGNHFFIWLWINHHQLSLIRRCLVFSANHVLPLMQVIFLLHWKCFYYFLQLWFWRHFPEEKNDRQNWVVYLLICRVLCIWYFCDIRTNVYSTPLNSLKQQNPWDISREIKFCATSLRGWEHIYKWKHWNIKFLNKTEKWFP